MSLAPRENQTIDLASATDPETADMALVCRAVACILSNPSQRIDPASIATKLGVTETQMRVVLRSPFWLDAIKGEMQYLVHGLLHRSLQRLEGILIDEDSTPSAIIAATRAVVSLYTSLVDQAKKGHDAMQAEKRTLALIEKIRTPKTA